MCTAATYTAGDHYFGRNLDLELSYGEKVTITPRNFPLTFRKMPTLEHHYARIGMATTVDNYSRGLGTRGLPGGMDSMSRFVKVAFTKLNAPKGETENENVGNFFHILHSVEQQKNLDGVENNQFEFTIYSSCVNADRGIYYYTTYDNNQINAVDMHKVDLDGRELIDYDLANEQNINWQN